MTQIADIAVGQASVGDRARRSLARSFNRWSAPAGLLLAVGVIYIGWTGRATRDISAGEGLGYWLGIVGGTLMLALLLYSVRKRIPLLRNFGATRHWFRMHMTLGIVGPIIILYHSNFQLGSLNSQVALFCTLLVAASGVVGRYFYTQIHNGLYGSKVSLRQLSSTVDAGHESAAEQILGADLNRKLAALAQQVLEQSDSLAHAFVAPLMFGVRTRLMYWRMRAAAFRYIDARASGSETIRQQRRRLKRVAERYLAERLSEMRKVAQFGCFERLFSLWHVVHVPFFLLMVLSAVLHVLAVHLY